MVGAGAGEGQLLGGYAGSDRQAGGYWGGKRGKWGRGLQIFWWVWDNSGIICSNLISTMK